MQVAEAGRGRHPAGLSPHEAVAQTREHGNFLGMEFGHGYDGATITADGTAPTSVDNAVSDDIPTARPGHRLPHLWLPHDGTRRSAAELGCWLIQSIVQNLNSQLFAWQTRR